MPLLGLPHLLILLAIAAGAAGLTRIARKSPEWRARLPFALGVILAGNELLWYGFVLRTYGFRFPGGLPLDLCDVMVWLTVLAVFTRRLGIYEVAYYGGLGGSTMALLTPDLGLRLPSYPAVSFFISHGLTVITLCVLTGSHLLRPRPGSLWRVFGILNLYTVAVGVFNAEFGTNYMYLRAKPRMPRSWASSDPGRFMSWLPISSRWEFFGYFRFPFAMPESPRSPAGSTGKILL